MAQPQQRAGSGGGAARARQWTEFGKAAGAGLACSALFALALPPFNFWILSFAAIIPLAWAARCVKLRPRGTALGVMLGVLPFWLFELRWIFWITDLGYLPLCVLFSLYAGAFAWIVARVSRGTSIPMTLAVPVAWVGLEFLRGELAFNGYAIALVAHPLIESPGLARPAAWGGAYLVSLLVAVPAGCVLDALRQTALSRVWAVGGLVLMLTVFAIGAGRAHDRSGATSSLRVALVQTNVPESNKTGWTPSQQVRDWERILELFGKAMTPQRPDVLMLPETMMPGTTLEPSALSELMANRIELRDPDGGVSVPAWAFAEELFRVQLSTGVSMLVGEEGLEGLNIKVEPNGDVEFERKHRYNSVYLVERGGVISPRYDKMRLTPFGEYMPYIDAWPWLRNQIKSIAAHGMSLDLSPGETKRVFEIPCAAGGTARIVTPICFEVTIGGFCRSLAFANGKRRADVIANITNDGWFGTSDDARLQHLQISRWRCLELNTPMVRAANTGMSAVIDARGRVLKAGPDGASTPARVDGVINAEVPFEPDAAPTLYARIGDVVGWAAFAGGIALAVVAATARREKGETTRTA